MTRKIKVFGIGFHKTATSSLANALYTLGYNVTGYYGVHDPEIASVALSRAFELANRFDAAQDTPWPVLFRELDSEFPGSKFVLTVRAPEKWVNSVVKHFKGYNISAHEWIYGVKTAKGNEEIYIQRYLRHNQEVIEYFKDRPNDLLVMDITKGDGWEKLCPFLGLEIPPFAFPTQNTSAQKSKQIVKRGIRFLLRKLEATHLFKRKYPMDVGVSSAFVRDILHYHYAMFGQVWDAVHKISAEQFTQVQHGGNDSIRDHLMSQIINEYTWLTRLDDTAQTLIPNPDPSGFQSKEVVFQLWKDVRILLRQYVANLTDEVRDQRVPNRKEHVWEVLTHIMDDGAKKRSSIQGILFQCGVEVDEQNFIRFFYPDT